MQRPKRQYKTLRSSHGTGWALQIRGRGHVAGGGMEITTAETAFVIVPRVAVFESIYLVRTSRTGFGGEHNTWRVLGWLHVNLSPITLWILRP